MPKFHSISQRTPPKTEGFWLFPIQIDSSGVWCGTYLPRLAAGSSRLFLLKANLSQSETNFRICHETVPN
jgi:hypothetical protein